VYNVQASLVAQLDYGFLSEISTRWSMLITTDLTPFLQDMYDLIEQPVVDWYLVGFRFGMFWKVAMDVQIEE